MISFKVDEKESDLIHQIAKRAVEKYGGNMLNLEMDITACHANGNPLKLEDLYSADDLNFAHDVFGIARHINRKTGKLENCFLPRFSK